MKLYTINAILKGIREKDNKVLYYIYQESYPAIKKHIVNNSGNAEDAKDIFQDAIVIIYNKSNKNDFNLDCDFSTYLYSICKILWLKELRKKKNEKSNNKELQDFLKYQDDIIGSDGVSEKYAIYYKYINKLDYDCQKILRLFYDGVKVEEIVNIMGYKNEHIARSKKFKCKEKLLKWIRKDPNFNGRNDNG
ncbi:hypothetical protein ES708_09948 [subsurface metagenome]